VPTLVLDDGTVVDESANIAAWAAANPSAGTPTMAEAPGAPASG
jgi:hypothetical protein